MFTRSDVLRVCPKCQRRTTQLECPLCQWSTTLKKFLLTLTFLLLTLPVNAALIPFDIDMEAYGGTTGLFPGRQHYIRQYNDIAAFRFELSDDYIINEIIQDYLVDAPFPENTLPPLTAQISVHDSADNILSDTERITDIRSQLFTRTFALAQTYNVNTSYTLNTSLTLERGKYWLLLRNAPDGRVGDFEFTGVVAHAPEPTTLLTFLLGGSGLWAARKKNVGR